MSRPQSICAAALILVLCSSALGDESAVTEKTRFDYHTVRGRQAKSVASGIFEGESHLALQGKSRVQGMRGFGAGWSGDAHLLWDGRVGESMKTTFRVERAGRFRLSMQLTKAPDYGVFSVRLNDKEIHKNVDLHAPRVELAERLDCGKVALASGEQKLVFTLTGANERATNRSVNAADDKSIDHHGWTHNQNNQRVRQDLQRLDRFHIDQFGRLVATMDAISEGESTLFDNMIFTLGSGLSSGALHVYTDLPTIIAGRGGGRIAPNRHVKYAEGTPIANLWLTMAQMMGVKTVRIGDSTGP